MCTHWVSINARCTRNARLGSCVMKSYEQFHFMSADALTINLRIFNYSFWRFAYVQTSAEMEFLIDLILYINYLHVYSITRQLLNLPLSRKMKIMFVGWKGLSVYVIICCALRIMETKCHPVERERKLHMGKFKGDKKGNIIWLLVYMQYPCFA